MMSPKAGGGEGRDRRGGSGGYRPREGSDPRTSSSERREAQDRQKTPRIGGKGNKQEVSGGSKAQQRQHPGTGQLRETEPAQVSSRKVFLFCFVLVLDCTSTTLNLYNIYI